MKRARIGFEHGKIGKLLIKLYRTLLEIRKSHWHLFGSRCDYRSGGQGWRRDRV